jgi:hypothetical protein
LQGSPENISRATEKIYKIVNKYYFFESRRRSDRSEDDSSRENDHRMRKYKIEEESNRRKLKRRGIRLGNRIDIKKMRNDEDIGEERIKEYKREKGKP